MSLREGAALAGSAPRGVRLLRRRRAGLGACCRRRHPTDDDARQRLDRTSDAALDSIDDGGVEIVGSGARRCSVERASGRRGQIWKEGGLVLVILVVEGGKAVARILRELGEVFISGSAGVGVLRASSDALVHVLLPARTELAAFVHGRIVVSQSGSELINGVSNLNVLGVDAVLGECDRLLEQSNAMLGRGVDGVCLCNDEKKRDDEVEHDHGRKVDWTFCRSLFAFGHKEQGVEEKVNLFLRPHSPPPPPPEALLCVAFKRCGEGAAPLRMEPYLRRCSSHTRSPIRSLANRMLSRIALRASFLSAGVAAATGAADAAPGRGSLRPLARTERHADLLSATAARAPALAGPRAPVDSYAPGSASQGAKMAASAASARRAPSAQRTSGQLSSGAASTARKPKSTSGGLNPEVRAQRTNSARRWAEGADCRANALFGATPTLAVAAVGYDVPEVTRHIPTPEPIPDVSRESLCWTCPGCVPDGSARLCSGLIAVAEGEDAHDHGEQINHSACDRK
eukprot:scaffold18116_cov123-Isochrysis_galbana.AAC.7